MPAHNLDFSDDEAARRRRDAAAERKRQSRARQRASRPAPPSRPSRRQLAQGELLVDFGSTMVNAAIPTDIASGIRVPLRDGMVDPEEVEIQFAALTVGDTADLYGAKPVRRRGVFDWDAPPEFQHSLILPASPTSVATSAEFDWVPVDEAGSSDEEPIPSSSRVRPVRVVESDVESEDSFHDAQSAPFDQETLSVNPLPSPPSGSTVSVTPDDEPTHPTAESNVVGTVDPEIAMEQVVDKLLRLLSSDIPHCTENEHTNQQVTHDIACDHQHTPLGQVNPDVPFRYVLDQPDLLTPQTLAESPSPAVSAWEELYCGLPPGSKPRPARHVCLHAEDTSDTGGQVSYDVDSLLGFAKSFAFARDGLCLTFAPQMKQNITADIHITAPIAVDGFEEVRSVPLRDIPHFQIGRLLQSSEVAVYIFLPQHHLADENFKAISHDTMERFYNNLYIPVLYERLPAHVLQHIPSSYRNGLAETRARQVEDRRVHSGSYQSQQHIVYDISPEYLVGLWEEVVERARSVAGLQDFQDMQIFFAAKNLKLRNKSHTSRPSLKDTLQRFETRFTEVVDLEHIDLDRFFVDIGQEICPEVSDQAHVPLASNGEPQVWLWKRCCLAQILSWTYGGDPPASTTSGQRFYTTNMLYDAAALTSCPPRSSDLYTAGVRYSQYYSSVKEIVDAAKCFPFNNEGLEELGLDPLLRKGSNSVLRGRRTETSILRQAYTTSKRRTHEAIRDSRRKSYGLRQEHRVSWPLFQRMRTRLASNTAECLPSTLTKAPIYAWPVRTTEYLNFLATSANKFAVGFEIALARCNPSVYSWEQTKVLIMFLRCLRYVFGGHLLQKESALWWTHRVGEDSEGRPQHRYGLGFEHTLKTYGYCWIQPIMDWSSLQFTTTVTDDVLFGNRVLGQECRRNGPWALIMFNFAKQNDMALNALRTMTLPPRKRQRMFEWLAHTVLRQFRIDVLLTVQKEIRYEFLAETSAGMIAFTRNFLEQTMRFSARWHFVSGNRSGKQTPIDLRSKLFRVGDGETREHWENKPYRGLYKRILAQLGNNRDDRLHFEQTLWLIFDQFHWVLPYPHTRGLCQPDKKGSRMWYSVIMKNGERVWGRTAYQTFPTGHEPKLPHWVMWSQLQWKEYIHGINLNSHNNDPISVPDEA